MNALQRLTPALDYAAWYFLTLVLQVTLVCLAALLPSLFLRRNASPRYAVLVCAIIVVALSPLSTRIAQRQHWLVNIELPAPVAHFAAESFRTPRDPCERDDSRRQLLSPQASFRQTVSQIVMLLWFSGIAVGLLRCAVGWTIALRCLAISKMDERLGSRVRLCRGIAGPVSVGLFRPIVLLPEDLPASLSTEQLNQVLNHEFAHAVRGDHLVAVIQQLVGALFWPHPLIHIINAALNRAREELCDNQVIQQHDRADYARTLLHIAQWMNARSSRVRAASLALIGRRGKLKQRIADLLDERRNLMTGTKLPAYVGSLLLFFSLAIVVSSAGVSRGDTKGAAPSTQPVDDALAWHDISVEMGERKFQSGDSVRISSVRCTADQLAMGELLEVRGTYDLHSADEASLSLFMTATDGDGTGPIYPQQTITVKQGHGEFVLREPITCHGWPHVSFYDEKSGQNIGGVYFGYGEWLNKDRKAGRDTVR